MQPSLIIGLGGTGTHIVSNVLAKLEGNSSTIEMIDSGMLQFLCIDADAHIAENLELPDKYKQSIGFFALPYIVQASQQDKNLQKWFDRKIIEHASLSPAQFDLTRNTDGYRQFGRLCLYHDLANGNYYSKVKASIHNTLSLIQQHSPDTPLVVICTSLIGGTGGAIALDLAYLVRRTLATIRMNPYDGHILGVFALSNVFASALSEERMIRCILNEVAAIKEIQYFAKSRYEFGPQGQVMTFDNFEPFNAYWLFGGDGAKRMENKWPTDYFPLIAAEILDAVLVNNWLMQPQECEYVNIQTPLTTNVIGDWTYWKNVYNRYSKDPNRLSPHFSHEFGKENKID